MKRMMMLFLLALTSVLIIGCDLGATTTTTEGTIPTTESATTATPPFSSTSSRGTVSPTPGWLVGWAFRWWPDEWPFPAWMEDPRTTTSTTGHSFPDDPEGILSERVYLLNEKLTEDAEIRSVHMEAVIDVFDETDTLEQRMFFSMDVHVDYAGDRVVCAVKEGDLDAGGFALENVNGYLALRTFDGMHLYTELAPSQDFYTLVNEQLGLFPEVSVMMGTVFTQQTNRFFTTLTKDAFLENRLYAAFFEQISYVPDDLDEEIQVQYYLSDNLPVLIESVRIPLHPTVLQEGWRAEMRLQTEYSGSSLAMPAYAEDAFEFAPRDKELAIPLDLTSRPVNVRLDVMVEIGNRPNYVAFFLDPGSYRIIDAETGDELGGSPHVEGPDGEILSLNSFVVETSGIYFLVLQGGTYDPIPIRVIENR